MSIGIDFILRANSASFTKGVAAANNAVKDLKKGLREFDVGNGAKNLLGIGGIIAGFRLAITNAQELRDEADKLGKEIDGGTRSVAQLGDAIGSIAKGFKNGLTEGLSFFTQLGDKARHFFQNVTQDQEDAARKMVETTGKAADEAEARLKKSREDNSPEKQAAAEEKLGKLQAQNAVKGTDAQKKLINLINERADLDEKLAKTPKETVAFKELQAQILQNELDTKSANEGFIKEADQLAEKKQEARNKLIDKIAPTIEELAQQDIASGTGGNDPRRRARQALKLEDQARAFGARGDIKRALELQNQAEGIRKGLSGQAAESQLLTPTTAKTAFEEALVDTNKELSELKAAISGIIKAQK